MLDNDLVHHPLVEHHLTTMRDERTSPAEFRRIVHRLSTLLAYEATRDLEVETVEIQTPVAATSGKLLQQRIGIVPILRAGLGMVDSVLDFIPEAEVWHLGMYRDEETATPVEYYSKLPKNRPVDVGFVLDPMLATGGSALLAIDSLNNWGVKSIKMLSIIASQEGIDNVISANPNVSVHVCAVDETLNANKFIVPGLGDAGDRIFNTGFA